MMPAIHEMMRPAIQQWAGFYQQSLGWSPVPLLPDDKKCIIPDWRNKDFRPEDFPTAANIGTKSVDGLVFFDDDCTKRALRMRCTTYWMTTTR